MGPLGKLGVTRVGLVAGSSSVIRLVVLVVCVVEGRGRDGLPFLKISWMESGAVMTSTEDLASFGLGLGVFALVC